MHPGVKPHRLWHWAAIAVVIATIYHNPGGSAELAITAIDRAGSGVGWALTRGGFDGESDYFVDPVIDTPASVTPSDQQTPAPAPPESGQIDLRGTADQLVVEVINLHELVEETLAPAPGEAAP